MKISDSALVMQSRHTLVQHSSVKENLRLTLTHAGAAPAASVTNSSAAQQLGSGVAATDSSGGDKTTDPKFQVLIQLIERITGRKVRIFDAGQLQTSTAAQTGSTPAKTANTPAQQTGFGLEYSKVSSYSEAEQTSFQASGVIKTADGKEIAFNLNLEMQRQYSISTTDTLQLGDAVQQTDPLIINFNGNAAQLSDMRFSFDLNTDGKAEQINAPLSGSGFLALDKNNDGKINNGSELFGPNSGDGFAELAQSDSNGDGWIDENDAVFKQLKVWTKNADGSDKLNSLADSGVGAISLQALKTPFDIKNAANQLQGTVRSSGVVLNEDGSVASVQQIDLTA